jgi:dihydrofolate reductase
MRIAIIAAAAKNGVIGKAGSLPWDLPEDRACFREKTLGRPVVMGRKTYDSIGGPLPGRRCIVLSRDRGLRIPGVEVAGSVEEALSLLAGTEGEVFVAGGAEVYTRCLPLADTMYLTVVDTEPEGDAYFPPFAAGQWREVSSRPGVDPASGVRYTFKVYFRRKGRGD